MRLKRYLDEHPTGGPALTELLSAVWENLEGDDLAMEARKLWRIENPRWEPPVLTFTIERHGGTVLGSKRAGLQGWVVDLDAMTKSAYSAGFRQLEPNALGLDVSPLAQEVAEAVRSGADDPRVRWRGDRLRFRVLTSRILPTGSPKRTYEGRAQRLHAALCVELGKYGWQQARGGWFERPGDSANAEVPR